MSEVPASLSQYSPSQLMQMAKDANKILAERHLYHFVKMMWHIVEPSRGLLDGWPLRAICDHLEAVTDGRIQRLLMNVPPGFMKSLLTDVFWPAWEWGPRNMPSTRYVAFSYSSSLTNRDNIRFRRVILSDLYQELWGDRVQPSPDQFNVVKVANDKTGWKLATSVGGVGTGERGDRLIVDDPNSVLEAESEQIRGTTNMWFREVLPDRLNDLTTGVTVVIQQRTHEEDVSGVILSEDLGYEVLCIPMEYDSRRPCVTCIGWNDPRTIDGELAWPERFPPDVVTNLRVAKGEYAYAGQYQQSPAPRGGGIIKRDWWQLYPPEGEGFDAQGNAIKTLHFPPMEYVVMAVDTAYTTKEENDPSAVTIWGVWRDRNDIARVLLMNSWEGRLEFHQLVEKLKDMAQLAPGVYVDRVIIEAKASGISVAQEMARLIGGAEYGVSLMDPKGDKVARVYSIQHLFENGLVFAPDRRFADRVIDNVSIFPRGKHDDLTDTVSCALKHIRDSGLLLMPEEQAYNFGRMVDYSNRVPRQLPYDV